MNFLRKELAPITDAGWQAIESEVQEVLKANLTGRRVVDFDGPHGMEYSSVNLGQLSSWQSTSDGVQFGLRRVQPLVEVRIPFQLDIHGLDDLARGTNDPPLDAAVEAALRLASLEERAIYEGFSGAGVVGLSEASEHAPIGLGTTAGEHVDAVAQAALCLTERGVVGPYALVLGADTYRRIAADVSSYPPRDRIARLIEGPILHSRVLEGGFLLSLRGGDFRLSVGQDVSLGYESHDQERVSLYLTETFTFLATGSDAVCSLVPAQSSS